MQIAALSPADINYDETLSTLRFGIIYDPPPIHKVNDMCDILAIVLACVFIIYS